MRVGLSNRFLKCVSNRVSFIALKHYPSSWTRYVNAKPTLLKMDQAEFVWFVQMSAGIRRLTYGEAYLARVDDDLWRKAHWFHTAHHRVENAH